MSKLILHVISSTESFVRFVLDTGVIVAALRSDRGASRQILLATLDSHIEVLISVPLLFEYQAVLSRSEHLEAARLNSQEIGEILDALVQVATPVHLRFLWRPRLKDPADEMVLETVVNGRADWLVTFNIRHLAGPAQIFGIQVVQPREAWKEIRKQNEKE